MAQQMRIEEFARDKKPLLGKAPFATDKQHALFDFYTNEKGFQFFIGDAAIPFAEGEGCITLTLPDRTEYLTVKHPEYGQLTWKIPGKELRLPCLSSHGKPDQRVPTRETVGCIYRQSCPCNRLC